MNYPVVRKILWGIGILAAALLLFGAGAAVGYRKAIFSSEWGENYYHNFFGGRRGGFAFGMMGGDEWNTHGAFGKVIGVSSSTISLQDAQGNERLVSVGSGTLIRKYSGEISLGDVRYGDQIVAIGEPSSSGMLEARFVRIFEASSSPWMMQQ